MDNTDYKILRILQEDARISASEISKQVDLSVSAVSERIRKMENAGIIQQYTTILNPVVFEKELTAFMLISLQRPQVSPIFLDFVASEPEVLSCYYIAGDYDYVIKIVTKNTKTLAEMLDRIKSINGIIKTNTMVMLSAQKENITFEV